MPASLYLEPGNSHVPVRAGKNRFECREAEKRIESCTCFLEQFSRHQAVNTGSNFCLFVYSLKTEVSVMVFWSKGDAYSVTSEQVKNSYGTGFS